MKSRFLMQGPILICPRTRIDDELIMDLKV